MLCSITSAMAKNDKILIDGIIDERVEIKLPSSKRDEAFEYFAFEQILKDHDLSSEELKSGNVDGRNDGGIDGFFTLINGHLLTEPESFNWPKTGCVLDVWIITCKHHDTFKQAPLDSLVASVSELLDFSIESKNLKGDYSETIIGNRENLKLAYRKVSPRLSKFSINYCYASRGNTSELGESIIARSEQVKQITQDSFGNCQASFNFFGSSELIELYRQIPNFSLELPFVEDLSQGERYVMLVNLQDYFNFISDNGKLRRYLFDSNVRDFMGLNRVNEDIKATLLDINSPDFWWLNNGVTILATGASVVGKAIQIEDIQIVNGLQTSESIFRHFSNGGNDPNKRSVLVKVVVTKEDSVRDTIIRATNNQTVVELASLHATDKIQRDIEDILKKHELYYERRTNFYKNQGISSDQILTPLYLASGYVSLILKSPDQASRLRSKFMRSEVAYEKVFSVLTDLNVWPQIAFILKRSDDFLESVRPSGNSGSERFLKSRRHFLSYLTISRILGKFNFSINDIISFDLKDFNKSELATTWELITKYDGNIEYRNRAKVRMASFLRICQEAEKTWGTKGIQRFKGAKAPRVDFQKPKPESQVVEKKGTLEFALKINELLPDQPWKPGIEQEIIEKASCSRTDYFNAVKILIEEGYRNYQKDGVVYDDEGNVLTFDSEGVDSESLELKKE